MDSDKPVTMSIRKGDVTIEDERDIHPSMDSEMSIVTKAPIDFLKTCIIFVFPALGGLLFGVCCFNSGQESYREKAGCCKTCEFAARGHDDRLGFSCTDSKWAKHGATCAGYDIGSTSVAVPILENPAVNGVAW
jgi:hypothetical protein